MNDGVKFDKGKTRWSLLPWDALHVVADVMTFGAVKYAPNNWQKIAHAKRRYFDAALRHATAWYTGEIHDPETGLHHLAHAVCCLLFIIWFEIDKKGNDNAEE